MMEEKEALRKDQEEQRKNKAVSMDLSGLKKSDKSEIMSEVVKRR